jgi:putative endonuclease
MTPKSYTAQRLPVKLVFHQFFQNIRKAIAFEKQVKEWSRKKKEAIITNNWESLINLSKNKTKKR